MTFVVSAGHRRAALAAGKTARPAAHTTAAAPNSSRRSGDGPAAIPAPMPL
jgi:hypothetical protein